mmetsp:Transcript_44660/g.113085  ORF Transcript_44660/g.113085 Transcript_44660/m.113085 type:complete len:125 (-) Transcript_44660:334-708(-)
MTEQSRAVRAMLARSKQDREERREREAIIEAQLAWERDREAREARELEQRQQTWAETVQLVANRDEDKALNKLREIKKDIPALLASPVAPGGATLLHLAVSRALERVIEARFPPSAARCTRPAH